MQSAAPKFFRSDADFPIFRGLCRARMPAGVWKTGCRRGQKRRRCGAAGGLVRTEGSGPVRRGGAYGRSEGVVCRGLFCLDSGARDALSGAFGCTPGFRVPANVSGPGGTLRATQRVIWKSCPHALSLRPEPFVEPCIAERDISTTVGGASLRVPSGFMSTGSAASSD